MLVSPLCDDLRENTLQLVTKVGMPLNDQFSTLLSNSEIQAELGKCVFRVMEM